MRHHLRVRSLLIAGALLALPSAALAGPPLICHPFQTDGGELLPWGSGPGWNTPDPGYDVKRLPADLKRLLAPDVPVLTRMENMRRAIVYTLHNEAVADEILRTFIARAEQVSGNGPDAVAALFDAGYLIETVKQGSTFKPGSLRALRTAWDKDGYAMVQRALALSGGSAEMEFAASLMSRGQQSEAHMERARAKASPVLARNLGSFAP